VIIKVAKALKQNGVPMDIIIKTTVLSESEINEL
jgi:ribosomal protein L39E